MGDRPWTKREDETARAFEAFRRYRDMGAARSQRKVHDQLYGEDQNCMSTIERWSTEYDWSDRVDAWDRHEDEQRRLERKKAREEARGVLVDAAKKLAEQLKRLALGLDDANPQQVKALDQALDRAGVTVPEEVDLTVNGSVDHGSEQLAETIDRLEDKSTAELAAAYFEAIEGGSEAEE